MSPTMDIFFLAHQAPEAVLEIKQVGCYVLKLLLNRIKLTPMSISARKQRFDAEVEA